MIVDLHTHSQCSDGTLTPRNLVMRAKAQNVDILALTDHDTTDGIAEASQAAAELGLRFIPGVEISVTWESQTVHIVGLRIDPNNELLQQGLRRMQETRVLRAEKLAAKLEANGIKNVLPGVRELAGVHAPTRTHFGRYLVANGIVRDLQESFDKWLGRKGRAYVRGEWAPLQDAVGWICAAGGQAVIAHPGRYQLTATKLRVMIEQFKSFGGVGIEVATSAHNEQIVQNMREMAKRCGLLASAGSDFHNPGHPRVELGRHVKLPSGVTPIWNDWEVAA